MTNKTLDEYRKSNSFPPPRSGHRQKPVSQSVCRSSSLCLCALKGCELHLTERLIRSVEPPGNGRVISEGGHVAHQRSVEWVHTVLCNAPGSQPSLNPLLIRLESRSWGRALQMILSQSPEITSLHTAADAYRCKTILVSSVKSKAWIYETVSVFSHPFPLISSSPYCSRLNQFRNRNHLGLGSKTTWLCLGKDHCLG